MAEFSTEGFVKDLSSDVVKVNLDRRRYKAQYCAALAGFRGYVIKREIHQSDLAKNEDNPDGFFTDFVIRLSRPCPVVDGKDNLQRAEAGEDILVACNDGLKGLLALADHPDYCAEIEVIPREKTKTAKGRPYWLFNIGIKNERVSKASVVPELGLLKSFDEETPKQLSIENGSAPA